MKNIVLIGMAGAGKSTIGVLLAKTMGMSFIDTDLVIQQNEGKLLQVLLDEQGIDNFIKIEEKAVLGLNAKNSIIATGGSVVYSEKSMLHLMKNGLVVYLKVPFDIIETRLKNITTRGVVMKKGSKLIDVYNERSPLYEKYADVIIDCKNKDTESIVDEIRRLFHNMNSQ